MKITTIDGVLTATAESLQDIQNLLNLQLRTAVASTEIKSYPKKQKLGGPVQCELCPKICANKRTYSHHRNLTHGIIANPEKHAYNQQYKKRKLKVKSYTGIATEDPGHTSFMDSIRG